MLVKGATGHWRDIDRCSWRYPGITLQWRHNWRDGVSKHQSHDRLLNRLSRCRSKKTSKLRVTGLCEGNSLVTGEFPTQRASNTENVSIWWRHHEIGECSLSKHLLACSVKTFSYVPLMVTSLNLETCADQCQLCPHWQQPRLLNRHPPVPPVKTNLSSWLLYGFSVRCKIQKAFIRLNIYKQQAFTD